MADKDPSKTEKATPKRRSKMREDGKVAKGEEIGKTMVLLAGVVAFRFLIGFYYEELFDIFTWTFTDGFTTDIGPQDAYNLFIWGIKEMALIVLPMMLIIMLTAIITLRLQVGKLWTFKPMEPKFAQMFNLVAGIKKLMISPEALIRLGKSMLQAAAVAIAPYIVITQEFPNLVPLFYATPMNIASYLLTVGYRMACYALVPMLLIAVADLFYQRWTFEENIKMSKDEVKDERRQAEGDPQIKQLQQRKMLEFMAKRMFADIPKADVVITNPTHYAVALQYDPFKAPAPLVLAKGVDRLAQRIKEVARENNIPLKENKPLAQALYKQVEIGETIPEELFQAVAAVLASLEKFKKR